ncbi:hypothetical protein ABEB36_014393 [Hypothenemus hampei]|uniref:Uncharacterized protein n=1 Tax=Hypothenemus hampei TaxID=57062 RepID=A0ABD1E4H7_HYPHA
MSIFDLPTTPATEGEIDQSAPNEGDPELLNKTPDNKNMYMALASTPVEDHNHPTTEDHINLAESRQVLTGIVEANQRCLPSTGKEADDSSGDEWIRELVKRTRRENDAVLDAKAAAPIQAERDDDSPRDREVARKKKKVNSPKDTYQTKDDAGQKMPGINMLLTDIYEEVQTLQEIINQTQNPSNELKETILTIIKMIAEAKKHSNRGKVNDVSETIKYTNITNQYIEEEIAGKITRQTALHCEQIEEKNKELKALQKRKRNSS